MRRRYLGLNSLLNLMNRWALGLHGLRFPLFMTACHMIFGSCALSPLMFLSPKYSDKHVGVLQNDWKGLVTIALMNGFQIACNNASLTVMELSMNQARACSLAALRPAPCTLRPAPCTLHPAPCSTRPTRLPAAAASPAGMPGGAAAGVPAHRLVEAVASGRGAAASSDPQTDGARRCLPHGEGCRAQKDPAHQVAS